jgi:hypothetical protein
VLFAAGNTWTLVTGLFLKNEYLRLSTMSCKLTHFWVLSGGPYMGSRSQNRPRFAGYYGFICNTDHKARVFTTVAILKASGRITGGPLMAKLFL